MEDDKLGLKINTRKATREMIKPFGTPRLQIAKESFRWKAAELYNSIPTSLTDIPEVRRFKMEVKLWIRDNASFHT